MTNHNTIYRTSSLRLCPYLVMNGLIYFGTEMDDDNKVVFVFKDECGIGHDLARNFMRSKEKEYKTHWDFFRNEIAVLKKKIQEELKLTTKGK